MIRFPLFIPVMLGSASPLGCSMTITMLIHAVCRSGEMPQQLDAAAVDNCAPDRAQVRFCPKVVKVP